MKHTLILATIPILVLLLVAAGTATFAGAEGDEDQPAEATTEASDAAEINSGDYKAGLWNNGQAAFSDVPLLDMLTRTDGEYQPYVRGYRPEQPINYSHKVHVEQNKMECQYCHSGVHKSPYATMPSMELCMGCHATVATDSEEIKKLKKLYDERKPVPWAPVNNLPEHAYFTHERHVKAGIGCHQCHGQVQEQDVVEKVSSLKMGFCVGCHRENGASTDCLVCHQ